MLFIADGVIQLGVAVQGVSLSAGFDVIEINRNIIGHGNSLQTVFVSPIDSVTVTADKVPDITVELWQKLENVPGSDTLYDTYVVTPDKDGNWSLTVKDLPKATKNQDGTRGATYLYYIKEVGVSGYVLESSENNNGINSGTIKLWNRETNGYELPETGGAGITAYRLLGGGMMLMPIPILWRKKKTRPRGRGADGS